jgi:mannose-6-phosphate isomerase-like protein (cupin superfamily)
MLQTSEAIRITHPAQAEVLDVFGAPLVVLSDTSNLPLMLGNHVVPPGYNVLLHVHEHDDEVFVILQVELTVAGPAGRDPHRPRRQRRIAARRSAQLP